AAGYNRYLRDTGTAHLPDPTCRGAAWVRPITALDIWTLIYNFDQTAGADQVKQSIAMASPPSAGTPAQSLTPAPAALWVRRWAATRSAWAGRRPLPMTACCWPTRTSPGPAGVVSTRCS